MLDHPLSRVMTGREGTTIVGGTVLATLPQGQRAGYAHHGDETGASMHKSIPLISIFASVLFTFTARAENWPSRLIKATIPLGVEALPMTPAEMDDLVKRETAATMDVIKAAGIRS
jgi:hypothetical protein